MIYGKPKWGWFGKHSRKAEVFEYMLSNRAGGFEKHVVERIKDYFATLLKCIWHENFFSCFLLWNIYRKRFQTLKVLEKCKKHFLSFWLLKYAQFAFKFVPVIALPKSHVLSERDVTFCTIKYGKRTQYDASNNFAGELRVFWKPKKRFYIFPALSRLRKVLYRYPTARNKRTNFVSYALESSLNPYQAALSWFTFSTIMSKNNCYRQFLRWFPLKILVKMAKIELLKVGERILFEIKSIFNDVLLSKLWNFVLSKI